MILSQLTEKHPTQLNYFRKGVERFQKSRGNSELRKAMDTATAAEGQEWVPTGYSADMYDRVRLANKVGELFAEVKMPWPIYKLPIGGADATVYLQGEATSDTPTKIPASTPGTSGATLTAKKLAARVLFSEEFVEDSIVPVLDYVKNRIANGVSTGFEDAFLNGDADGTHQDSDTQAGAANLVAKAWDGLRKATASRNTNLTATPTITELRSLRASMGKYGKDVSKLVWICGIKGYYKLMNVAEFLTVDKYGPGATILSGEVGKIDNIPVIVSEKIREDLNATGVYDGVTTDKAILLLVHTPSFLRGLRRGIMVKGRYDEENDQNILVVTWRGAFSCLFNSATEQVAAKGVNWTA
jgi:HK97 family phage major capsid protein